MTKSEVKENIPGIRFKQLTRYLHQLSQILQIIILAHFTGGWHGDHMKDIMEFIEGEGWRKVGSMKSRKRFHATSLVKYKDFKDTTRGCN